MKSKEELNELKEEVETVSKRLIELAEEELEQVNGGMSTGATVQVKGEDIAKLNTTEALQGKVGGVVVISSEGQPGSEKHFRVR